MCDGRLPLIRLANAKDEIPSRKTHLSALTGNFWFLHRVGRLISCFHHLTANAIPLSQFANCKSQAVALSVCLSVGTCDTSNISCYYCSCLTDWLRDYSRISDYGAQREERWKRKYAAVAAEEMLCMLLWRRCINNAKMPRRIKRNLCLICQFAKTQVVLLLITIIVRMDVLRALLLFVQTRYEWMYLLHLFYTISTNDDDDDIFKLRYYRHTGHRCLSPSPSIYLNEWAEAPLKKIWPNIHHHYHHRAPRVLVSSGEYSWRNASE